jgi:Tetracyclin repressor-like, C-terminal domain
MFEELAARCVIRRRRGEPWPDALRRMARRWRAVAMAHPWSVEILSHRAQVGPQTLRLLDSWVAALDGMPGPLARKWAAVTAVNDYVVGYVVRESAQRAVVPDDPAAAREWQQKMSDYLRRVADEGSTPHIEPLLRGGFGRQPVSFDAGLGYVIAGIAAAFGEASP